MTFGNFEVPEPYVRKPLGSVRTVWVLLIFALVVAAGAVYINVTREHHVGGDPGGRILAVLKPAASALPTDAVVAYNHSGGPKWDSCDAMPGTYGWGSIATNISFKSAKSTASVLDHADKVLTSRGWTAVQRAIPSGGGLLSSWTKRIPSTGTYARVALSDNTPYRDWQLYGIADPVGQRVAGC